jgi:uncharacterized LabA/DUF88 family protein
MARTSSSRPDKPSATYPNYDFPALGATVCASNGWQLEQARFYTGIPDASDDPFWNYFWAGKLRTLSRQGVQVFSRSLRYRNKVVRLPDGSTHAFLTAEEKGIDVRIAIDVIRLAHANAYDVAIPFCQDQDLSELCSEIRTIAKEQNRWIKIASAFPVSPDYEEQARDSQFRLAQNRQSYLRWLS